MISGWRRGAGQAPSAWYFAGPLFVVNSCFIHVCVYLVFILCMFYVYFVFVWCFFCVYVTPAIAHRRFASLAVSRGAKPWWGRTLEGSGGGSGAFGPVDFAWRGRHFWP